ncbi:MAG: hemerythrin domain-containing protein [Vitreoscilla sp.]|nr:hemerythrin domain-containing protein [Vitreoscilla sp.]
MIWSDELLLGHPAIDAEHRELVALIGALLSCSEARLGEHLQAFTEHASAHFADEDREMAETDFPAAGCHADEHAKVVASAREVQALVAEGDVAIGRRFAEELARWFPGHVAHLDSALAHWLVKRRHGGAPLVLRRRLCATA